MNSSPTSGSFPVRGKGSFDDPLLSVIIPVYNEEAMLPAMFSRLYPALDACLLYTSRCV